ncbi:MAG TPA: hypothetical protein VGO11_02465 [Chthoniobacteraceae bacterium]|jgi:hypothetical protein|nr:hypothetical protein [Chthoniobacteraceae bacterium]
MRTLSAAELLSLWERGLPQPPVQRGLLLLGAAEETLGSTTGPRSVGQGEARLLRLRERLFGADMVALAVCPACGERVELQFRTGDVGGPAGDEEMPMEFQLAVEGFEVVFRLPTSVDLGGLDPRAEPGANRRRLLVACLLSARQGGTPMEAAHLPEAVVEAIAQRMAEADPQGDIRLELCCPQCREGWLAPLDVASFLWTELHAWAQRILREVHALALAYGWRESDILALTPWRRQAYLDLLTP